MSVLTEQLVFEATKQKPADVRTLVITGGQLCDISLISRMTRLELLSLAGNKIRSLQALSNCLNLTDVVLSQNAISDFAELEHLMGLPNLHTLSLAENPIAADPQYRERVYQTLPSLTRLDDTEFRRGGTAMRRRRMAPTPSFREVPVAPAQQSPPSPQPAPGKQTQPIAPTNPVKPPADAPRPPPRRLPQKNDKGILNAIFTLLPELSPESLQVVMKAARELGEK
jgi:hypothetical protein